MQVFPSILTDSEKRKFEYFYLSNFHTNAVDPLTKKPFKEVTRTLPTADLGYFLAIIKEKHTDGFNLTSLDGHNFQNLISAGAPEEVSRLIQVGTKVYWYFISSVGQNCPYFLGAAKLKDLRIVSVEQELFYRATKNDPKALLQLGSRFYHGSGLLPMNQALALACINHDTIDRDSDALYLRGVMRLKGEIPATNIQEALDDIKSAAFKNLPEALFTLGTFAETGQYSTQQSTVKAFGFYTRAAELNFPEAFVKLGNYYAFGKTFNSMPPYSTSDHYMAMRYYRKGALLGNREAMILIANMFESNPLLPSSPDLTAKYLYMAAQAGCQRSRERLTHYKYFKDRKPSIMDRLTTSEQTFLDPFDQYMPHEDRTLYFQPEELLKTHDRDIAYQCGIKLLEDTGVKIFLQKMKVNSLNVGPLATSRRKTALQLILLAAKLQHGDAYFVLGHAALHKLFVIQSPATPFSYFEKSVELGSVAGIYGLAQCYKAEIGVPFSYEKYLDCLRRALEKGHPLADHELAKAIELEHLSANDEPSQEAPESSVSPKKRGRPKKEIPTETNLEMTPPLHSSSTKRKRPENEEGATTRSKFRKTE